jgi:hypothetical protein
MSMVARDIPGFAGAHVADEIDMLVGEQGAHPSDDNMALHRQQAGALPARQFLAVHVECGLFPFGVGGSFVQRLVAMRDDLMHPLTVLFHQGLEALGVVVDLLILAIGVHDVQVADEGLRGFLGVWVSTPAFQDVALVRP